MNEVEKNLLEDQRVETDASLRFERDKADEGLSEKRKITEDMTDLQVKSDRTESDSVREQNRTDRDKEVDVTTELVEQRIEDDSALKLERLNMDAAIQTERVQKNSAAYEFLAKERGDTDENLSQERSDTDESVSSAYRRLDKEIGRHKITKDQLTSRDELIALVSHDLRNPIGAVFSCAEMLLAEAAFANMSSDVKYWIELMKRNSKTALNLISDILDMERIAEGKLVLSLEQQDLGVVIRSATEQFFHASAAKGILLRVTTPAMSAVKCDAERVRQVLSNLIGNALKFTPDSGSIVVVAEELTQEFRISVSDTGKGIKQGDQQRIFERYSQGQKQDSRGLGLGLYICGALIESHGGKIWVDSTEGKGSTFSFTLPK